MPPHPLKNFEVQKYYQNEPSFNGVYSGWAYVINLDEYADVGTHWIALYIKNNEIIYFDGFRV